MTRALPVPPETIAQVAHVQVPSWFSPGNCDYAPARQHRATLEPGDITAEYGTGRMLLLLKAMIGTHWGTLRPTLVSLRVAPVLTWCGLQCAAFSVDEHRMGKQTHDGA